MHGDAVQGDIAALVLKCVHVVKAEEWAALQHRLLQNSCNQKFTGSTSHHHAAHILRPAKLPSAIRAGTVQ